MSSAATAAHGQPQRRLPYRFARRHRVILELGGHHGTVKSVAPLDIALVSELQRFAAQPLRFEQIAARDFERLLLDHYQLGAQSTVAVAGSIAGSDGDIESLSAAMEAVAALSDLLEQQDSAPIIRLVNAMLAEAIQLRASDIHIEHYLRRLTLRFRIDGTLRTVVEPDYQLAAPLCSRIKLLAGLDIAERALPQDGRVSLTLGGREIDLRVSTLPSIHGERLVLRLLDKQRGTITLDNLGMATADITALENAVRRGGGVVLVTGPTGCGKSTTLYAAMSRINDGRRNILTIEDPVEYQLEGIGQTQVNQKSGLSFARGLRAILRQDPDVVMVGEIRDSETMETAIQASLTGHLVLSTLHTNSALGAVTRLVDMGAKPFLLASALSAIVAQRLLRKLCAHCKQPFAISREQQRQLARAGLPTTQLFQAAEQGCQHCHGEGYAGRVGVYELVVVDAPLRQLIHDGATEAQMTQQVRAAHPAIDSDALRHVAAGVVSFAELAALAGAQ